MTDETPAFLNSPLFGDVRAQARGWVCVIKTLQELKLWSGQERPAETGIEHACREIRELASRFSSVEHERDEAVRQVAELKAIIDADGSLVEWKDVLSTTRNAMQALAKASTILELEERIQTFIRKVLAQQVEEKAGTEHRNPTPATPSVSNPEG